MIFVLLFLFLISVSPALAVVDLSNVRSVTYYDYPYQIGSSRRFVDDFKKDIDAIQKNRFNTVWLVPVRDAFNPGVGVYSDQAFTDLRTTLALLKSKNMKAILPLNYGNGPQYKACDILTIPAAYQDHVDYIKNFMSRITDYANMTYILIFTESSWGCNGVTNFQYPEGGEILSKLIKNTVGRVPKDLPPELRSKFIIGFHDWFIREGWNQGTSAIYDANTYDFYSASSYANVGEDRNKLRDDIDIRIKRVRDFYPNLPIFWGETGASYCGGNDENLQSDQNKAIAEYLLEKKIGISVWMWKPVFAGEPDSFTKDCAFGGHAITHSDGSLSKTAEMLKVLYKPNIESAGVNAWGSGYAVSMVGKNLDGNIRAEIYVNGQLAKQNIPVTIGADATTFAFDTNLLKPYCQTGGCSIEVVLTDENGNKSNKQSAGTITPVFAINKADINKDGEIDSKDYGIWKGEYLGALSTKSADINGDNKVDLLDFGLWKTEYLKN